MLHVEFDVSTREKLPRSSVSLWRKNGKTARTKPKLISDEHISRDSSNTLSCASADIYDKYKFNSHSLTCDSRGCAILA